MKFTPYWLDTAPQRPDRSRTEVSGHVDVAVIGAGLTRDRPVHAGEHDGLFYSMGYSRHGVQMATYMGRQMAEYMNGVEEANLWRDIPFKRIPGHFIPPWFLPFAGAYYKCQDLIK